MRIETLVTIFGGVVFLGMVSGITTVAAVVLFP